MLRRLIILLLIVGCEDDPEGLCYYATAKIKLDSLAFTEVVLPFDTTFFNMHCEDGTTEKYCCNKGIKELTNIDGSAWSSDTSICIGSLFDFQYYSYDTLVQYPQLWTNSKNCSQFCNNDHPFYCD